ncbi:CZB domain-containing protein [Zoogloea sp. LCSB751]|uniref:CZB domain-containing protein n=1 Tax=Zoogloea sp. LCSB751 TaxID=1965277 RepID=UPI0009A4CB00|nr:CZB domain-containing protein [Zoogloea sp. LCSB751]
MDWKKWFRRERTDTAADDNEREEEPLTVLPGATSRPIDLDAIDAIEAHMRWKARLEARLFGAKKDLIAADQVFLDKRSTLGRWLYGRGQERFGTLDTFSELRRHHAEFHRYAGQAVLAFNAGQRDEAIRMVTGGDYARASQRLRQTITRLFEEAEGPRKA